MNLRTLVLNPEPRTLNPPMQINEALIRSVVAQVLSEVSRPTARRSPAKSFAGRHGVFTCADEAVAAARDAFEQLQRADDRGPQAGHRPHPPHLDRSVRRAGHDGDARDEDRPARAQDRKAQDARRADARRRVPAERSLQRRPRPGGDRARPVRRHRRDHARHALAAHAHRQRDQHAGGRQHGGRQPASQRQESGGRRGPPLQPGDSPRPGHRQPDLRHRRADAGIGQGPVRPSRRST